MICREEPAFDLQTLSRRQLGDIAAELGLPRDAAIDAVRASVSKLEPTRRRAVRAHIERIQFLI